MGIYAVTGSASGIGAATVTRLRADGHRVILVDIQQADIQADLTTAEGRRAAVKGIQQAAPDGLDGLIPCAGLGSHVTEQGLIASLNCNRYSYPKCESYDSLFSSS